MSSNSQDKTNVNFLDEWLIEQKLPINVPLQMKLLAYLGYLEVERDKLQRLSLSKARGAPKKKITRHMLRANKYLSAKGILEKKGHKNLSHKSVIEFLIQAVNILYDKGAISLEERALFSSPTIKSLQNTISIGLKELEEFPEK